MAAWSTTHLGQKTTSGDETLFSVNFIWPDKPRTQNSCLLQGINPQKPQMGISFDPSGYDTWSTFKGYAQGAIIGVVSGAAIGAGLASPVEWIAGGTAIAAGSLVRLQHLRHLCIWSICADVW